MGVPEYLPTRRAFVRLRETASQGRGHEPLEGLILCPAADTAAALSPFGVGLSPARRIRLRATVSTLSSRQRASFAIHLVALAGLIPAFIWLAPPSRWDQPGLLLVLLVLAVVGVLQRRSAAGRRALRRRPAAGADHARRARPAAGPARRPGAAGRRRPGRAHAHPADREPPPTSRPGAGRPSRLPRCCRRWARPRWAPTRCRGWLLAGVVMCFVNFSIAPGVYLPLHLGHPVVDAAADVRRHAADGAGHGRARRVHRRARRAARRARAGAVRADRRAAAERAHLRGTHAPGRSARSADRHAPLRARARAASRAQPRRAPPSRRGSRSSRSTAAPTPATRSPTPARRCATRAARAGRPGTSASGGTAAAARPGCAAR